MPIQLVLQGGGAKLIALLAAMEAVEELEANGRIVVTRLCGTSAGAIAACLFAARVPMKEARGSRRPPNEEALVSLLAQPAEGERSLPFELHGIDQGFFQETSAGGKRHVHLYHWARQRHREAY